MEQKERERSAAASAFFREGPPPEGWESKCALRACKEELFNTRMNPTVKKLQQDRA